MDPVRLEKLLEFLKAEPNDPFNIYAVATEIVGFDPERALPYYSRLLEEHPEYVPTYYHAAATYAELGMTEEAEQTYKLGIEVCMKANEAFALRELKGAYQNFLFEYK